jgi:hypothetical protein
MFELKSVLDLVCISSDYLLCPLYPIAPEIKFFLSSFWLVMVFVVPPASSWQPFLLKTHLWVLKFRLDEFLFET